ncbi:hypothetical protein JAAARDRAFT_197929 [Jaapia argillacea MUCL 33604]|uniref:Uncharacterized protein n=1 Tax=Jaapia argillacea MUCL 33604 TaxID=933084 RepID=A0A067PRC2_9AGAM|nr:hypothetical protein JAAARDRAFT_197929 [Jaapia argillacea MUCL 33604]
MDMANIYDLSYEQAQLQYPPPSCIPTLLILDTNHSAAPSITGTPPPTRAPTPPTMTTFSLPPGVILPPGFTIPSDATIHIPPKDLNMIWREIP